jgi:hypothetical protein
MRGTDTESDDTVSPSYKAINLFPGEQKRVAVATAAYIGSAASLILVLPSSNQQSLVMFFTSILVKALQKLLGCNKAEDAAGRDRFSELPDALLLNILERVGTLDAVRACVLSNHLLKLPAMLSRIAIDVCYIWGEYVDPTDLEFDDMLQANRAVANLTDKILGTRPPQLTIHDLNLTFVLRLDNCLSIGRSVAHTMATRKLGMVQLKILTEKAGFDCTPADLLGFGKQLNAFFADCQDAFAGLTILDLQNLRFGESDLPNILGTCKRLEYLSLNFCDAGIGSTLKFEHDRLVELKIEYGEYETVELCRLPKLQRMTCDYWDHDRNPLISFWFRPAAFQA